MFLLMFQWKLYEILYKCGCWHILCLVKSLLLNLILYAWVPFYYFRNTLQLLYCSNLNIPLTKGRRREMEYHINFRRQSHGQVGVGSKSNKLSQGRTLYWLTEDCCSLWSCIISYRSFIIHESWNTEVGPNKCYAVPLILNKINVSGTLGLNIAFSLWWIFTLKS